MAYAQLPVTAETAQILTIATHKGLYRVNRLAFGVSTAPAIFQRTINGLLQGIRNVVVLLDDILLAAANTQELLQLEDLVLGRLSSQGFRLRFSKCEFDVTRVRYLGHEVSADGLKPLQERVQDLKDAPAPTSTQQLQAFLGKMAFYDRFLPRRAEVCKPLYALLEKDAEWIWNAEHEAAFQTAKALLCSGEVLCHYSLDLPLILGVDSSAYGFGAVLGHEMQDGSERPIAYASCTLTPAQRNYSQLDKEFAAILFGVNEFHAYLAGREFTIYTDHQPLVGMVQNSASPVASPRVLRGLLRLGAYHFRLVYRPGKDHANADCLSRLPSPQQEQEQDVTVAYVHQVERTGSIEFAVARVEEETAKDPLLQQVWQHVVNGWPAEVPAELSPYRQRQRELSTLRGCLLWGSRVIIPAVMREGVLDRLHAGHPGIVRSKRLARVTLWWPGIGDDIERQVQGCEECQTTHRSAPASLPVPWPPARPWGRIHLDFGGPLGGRWLLVMVDSNTNWLEGFWKPGPSTAAVIEGLRRAFATHGLCDTIVSDNAPCFVSEQMKAFCKEQGIDLIHAPPYLPQANGPAEKGVQSLKGMIEKMGDKTKEEALAEALHTHRNTPGADGRTPAQKLMSRTPQTVLDKLNPTRLPNREPASEEPRFMEGEAVWFKVFHGSKDNFSWKAGVVMRVWGSKVYDIKPMLQEMAPQRRGVDQLRRRRQDAARGYGDRVPPPFRPRRDTPASPMGQLPDSSEDEGEADDREREWPRRTPRDVTPPHRGREVPPPAPQGARAAPPRRSRDVTPPRRSRDATPPHRGREVPPPAPQGARAAPPRRGRDITPPHRGRDVSPPAPQGARAAPSRRGRDDTPPARREARTRSVPARRGRDGHPAARKEAAARRHGSLGREPTRHGPRTPPPARRRARGPHTPSPPRREGHAQTRGRGRRRARSPSQQRRGTSAARRRGRQASKDSRRGPHTPSPARQPTYKWQAEDGTPRLVMSRTPDHREEAPFPPEAIPRRARGGSTATSSGTANSPSIVWPLGATKADKRAYRKAKLEHLRYGKPIPVWPPGVSRTPAWRGREKSFTPLPPPRASPDQ
ncbi:hypothetical protein ONE63_001011 [Megalurothrips usitatus]|uniref:RNA-directed DNA polymerase n=1 Tax=Megalurothrips usitatus TaxID=439358 RepID=A0AAV7XEI1_9NEOP|nr:hypothetical protein ONE63_001011 [Megalurothrips usitatus]